MKNPFLERLVTELSFQDTPRLTAAHILTVENVLIDMKKSYMEENTEAFKKPVQQQLPAEVFNNTEF